MLKYALRRNSLNFTEGLSWAQELSEIEAMQKDAIPTDMYSYIKNMSVEEEEDDDDWEDEDDTESEDSDESEDSETSEDSDDDDDD